MSARAATWLAWSLWTISVVLTALSLLLLVLNLSHPGTHIFDWWLGNATIVIDVTVGAIVASRRPENPVGWLLCLSGVDCQHEQLHFPVRHLRPAGPARLTASG